MTQISSSYPYLSIAKKYNLPYGVVLDIADQRMRGNNIISVSNVEDTFNLCNDTFYDIDRAVKYFKDVRGGVMLHSHLLVGYLTASSRRVKVTSSL